MIFCDDNLSDSLKKRYSRLHPLVVQRSLEKAQSLSDLFSILESVPKKPPFVWDFKKRSWTKCSDISAKKQLEGMLLEGS